MFVMDLPQLPGEKEASQNWTVMIRKLQGFLETTFGRKIDDERIELEIRDTNLKNALMQKLFDFGAMNPPPVHWTELYDVIYLAQASSGAEMKPIVEECITRLEKRVREGVFFGKPAAPRVWLPVVRLAATRPRYSESSRRPEESSSLSIRAPG